jgi:hypothetical protein
MRGPDIPNCLRMAFHDAGTHTTNGDGGANGSILLELADSQNTGLTLCPAVIRDVVATVRSAAGGCPLTNADAIQIAGAVAVYMSGGPMCPMLLGRSDSNTPDRVALPNICDNAATSVQRFATMGFANPALAVATLSGAHNIGSSRATPRGQCSRGLVSAEPPLVVSFLLAPRCLASFPCQEPPLPF